MPHDYLRAARTILLLGLAPAIGLGMARFAYAIILPDMRQDLEWTYAQAGFMNTVNAAGYLAGALAGAAVIRRIQAFPALMLGAATCAIALLASAATTNFALLSIARAVAGVAAALTFVGGGALAATVSQRFPEQTSFLLALFYAGPGFGFIVSGACLPALLAYAGPGSWWIGWATLAAFAALMTAALPFAKVGAGANASTTTSEPILLTGFALFLVGYVAYGGGISAYFTFVIAWLAATGQSIATQSLVWVAVGAGCLSAPWIWHAIIGGVRGGRAAAVIILATMAGAAIPLVAGHAIALLTSAFAVGTACFTVVAATTAFVRRNLAQNQWPAGIGIMTGCFGAGQMLGPVLAGAITDHMGSLSAGLWCAVALLAAGSVLTALQNDAGAAVSTTLHTRA